MNEVRNELIIGCQDNKLRGTYAYIFTHKYGETIELFRFTLHKYDLFQNFEKWLLDAVFNEVVEITSFDKIFEFKEPSDDFFDYLETGNWTCVNLKLLV